MNYYLIKKIAIYLYFLKLILVVSAIIINCMLTIIFFMSMINYLGFLFYNNF